MTRTKTVDSAGELRSCLLARHQKLQLKRPLPHPTPGVNQNTFPMPHEPRLFRIDGQHEHLRGGLTVETSLCTPAAFVMGRLLYSSLLPETKRTGLGGEFRALPMHRRIGE